MSTREFITTALAWLCVSGTLLGITYMINYAPSQTSLPMPACVEVAQ